MKLKKNITALLLALTMICPAALPADKVRADGDDEDFATEEQLSELAELQRREAELAARAESLENDMSYIRRDVENLQASSQELGSYLSELKAQGVILEDDYQRLTNELAAAKAAMDQAVAEYDQAVEDVDDKQAEYEDRLVAMYKRSKQSKLEVLLSSNGLTGFFTNLELLGVIGRSDKQILEDLTAARETAEVKKQVAEDSKEQYELFVADKKKEIDILAAGISTTEEDIAALQQQIINRSADLSYYQGLYADNDAAQSSLSSQRSSLEGEIRQQAEATRSAWAEATRAAEQAKREEEERRAKEEEEAASGESSGESSAPAIDVRASGAVYPAPGNYYISSYYGWRPYPLNPSMQDFHSGLDLPGNFNDPVVAAWDGVVVEVGYPLPNANYGGWGLCNYIEIQHDSGIRSIYGHLKSIYVTPGQTVTAGELIGGIGSTGYSTGPHLHFELRNPDDPNKSLYDSIDPYPYLFG